MKFVVTWNRKKKKETSTQSATFYTIEDAIFWENHLKRSEDHTSIETKPVFSS